jgi:hypothetical protein
VTEGAGFDGSLNLVSSQSMISNGSYTRKPRKWSNSMGMPRKRYQSHNNQQHGLDNSRSNSFISSGRSRRKRSLSNESRKSLNLSQTRKSKQHKKKNKDKKNPHLLTTQIPSKYVVRSPPGL